MELKKEWGKRSKESRIVLIIVIILTIYLSNTSNTIIINGISNFLFSIIASLILIILWFVLTRK